MDNKDLHAAYIKLMELGATEEDIIKLFKIGFETADIIIKNN